jgi:hypothetical protein
MMTLGVSKFLNYVVNPHVKILKSNDNDMDIASLPSEVAVAKPATKTAALAIAMKSVACTKKEVAGKVSVYFWLKVAELEILALGCEQAGTECRLYTLHTPSATCSDTCPNTYYKSLSCLSFL